MKAIISILAAVWMVACQSPHEITHGANQLRTGDGYLDAAEQAEPEWILAIAPLPAARVGRDGLFGLRLSDLAVEQGVVVEAEVIGQGYPVPCEERDYQPQTINDDPGGLVLYCDVEITDLEDGWHSVRYRLVGGSVILTREVQVNVRSTLPEIAQFAVSEDTSAGGLRVQWEVQTPGDVRVALLGNQIDFPMPATRSGSVVLDDDMWSDLQEIQLEVVDEFGNVSKAVWP